MSDIQPLPSPCGGPSLHELRRYESGELSETDRSRVRSHAEHCARCQTALFEFVADRRAVRTAVPFAALERRLEAQRSSFLSRWRRIALGLVLPIAAGAAALLLVPFLGVDHSVPSPAVRTKGGGPTLDFVVKSGDRIHDGHDGEKLQTGDALRFRYSAAGLPYVLIVGVDSDGKLFPYLSAGDRSARAETGAVLSPNAIVLDNDPRPERVFAIYSQDPVAVDEVAPAIHDGLRTAHGRIDAMSMLPGFPTQATLLLNKTAR
jgi:anti-sigma factor RsiW